MKSWCLGDGNLCPPSAPLASGISLQLLRERHPSSQPPRCLPLPRLSRLSRGNQTLPGKSCFISTYTHTPPPSYKLVGLAGGKGGSARLEPVPQSCGRAWACQSLSQKKPPRKEKDAGREEIQLLALAAPSE